MHEDGGRDETGDDEIEITREVPESGAGERVMHEVILAHLVDSTLDCA